MARISTNEILNVLSAKCLRTSRHSDILWQLAIALHVVKINGGRVELERKLGQGSTFRIVLPAQKGGKTAYKAGRNEPTDAAGGSKRTEEVWSCPTTAKRRHQ